MPSIPYSHYSLRPPQPAVIQVSSEVILAYETNPENLDIDAEKQNSAQPGEAWISTESCEIATHRDLLTGPTGINDPKFEIDWEDGNDPENPRNWSLRYKGMCIAILSWNTLITFVFSDLFAPFPFLVVCHGLPGQLGTLIADKTNNQVCFIQLHIQPLFRR